MSLYRRRPSGPNISPVFTWLLLIGGIAFGIYKISNAVKQVNEVHDAEMREKRVKDSISESSRHTPGPASGTP